MMKKLSYFVLILLVACGKKVVTENHPTKSRDASITKKSDLPDSTLLRNKSTDVILGLENDDYYYLSTLFHPTIPVRFSPYAFIDTLKDVQMDPEVFLKYCGTDRKKKIKWGNIDPTGEDILFSVPQYLQLWVYRQDFKKAPCITLNECKAGGNTINNIREVYKGCEFVEYYFPGFDPDFDGMDWQALRLVFKKHDGEYYLVGIINDEWST